MFRKNLLFALLLGAGALWAADPNPMLYQRVSTGKTPVIDGTISANEWTDAAVLPPFARVKGGSPLWTKLNKIMLKFDAENLYIGFRTHMAIDMNLSPVPADSALMSNVESFDIRFVIPGQPRWRRFMVERGGAKLDQLFRGHIMDNPADWNPEWQYKCRLIPQDFTSWSIWEGEIAIPWKTLGMPYPEKGQKISALFIRNLGNTALATDEEGRVVSWAPVSNNTDLIFDANYGALMLEPGKPVFRMDSMQNYSRSVVGVKGQIVNQTEGVGGKVNSAIWDPKNPKRMFDYTDAKVGVNAVNWKKAIQVKQAEPGNGRIFIYDAAGGFLCKYPFHTTILPSFYSNVVWNNADDKAHFAGQSFQGFKKGDKILFAVASAEGKVYASQELTTEDFSNSFDAALSCAQVPEESEFIASAALIRGDKEIAKSQYKIKKHFPEWRGTLERFKVTAPPLGWVALQSTEEAGKTKVTMRDHAYLFGNSLLPEKVILHNEEFSAGAWKLAAETDQGVENFTGNAKVTAKDGRGITICYQGESDHLKLAADIRVEFDGMAWYNCRFTPKAEKVTVKHLAIECPIVPEKLRYMRSSYYQIGSTTNRYALIGPAKRSEELPPMAVSFAGGYSSTGWKYGDSFNYCYWIGGEDRGTLFVLPSTENTSIDKIYNKVEDQPGKFSFALELINQPVSWKKPVNYQFGIFLTPTHKPVNPAGLRRIGQFALGLEPGKEHVRNLTITEKIYTNDKHISWRFPKPDGDFELAEDFLFQDLVGSWLMRDVMDGNFRPAQKDIDEIRRQCKGIREGHHGKPYLWYDMLVTPPAKDLEPYFAEWCTAPRTDMPADVYVTVLCPASAWKEAYLWGMQNRMKDGVCGFYMDMSGLRTCSNRMHGCGYYDEKGNLKATLPFLPFREYMLMVQKAIKENDPDGVFAYHGSGPMDLWTDHHQECEYWQYAPDYSTLHPEFLQLEMFSQAQSGSRSCLINSLCTRHVPGALKTKMPQLDPLGLALVHDLHCHNTHALEIYGNYITTKPLLDFGVDDPDCVYIPYWRNPRSLYPGKGSVAVSSYKKGNRELAVIFNVSATDMMELDLGDQAGTSRLGEEETLSGVVEIPPRTLKIVEFPAK